MRAPTLAVALVLVFLASGCGGKDDAEKSSASSSASSGQGTGSNPSTPSTPGAPDAPSASETAKAGTSADGDGSASTGATISPKQAAEDHRGAPGLPDAQGRQSVVFTRLPGNTSGTCLSVAGRRDVRSGGFVTGPFDDARKSFGKVRPGFTRNQVRLYFVPLHSKPMNGVTVTATSGSTTVSKTQKIVADAEQWKFYDVILTLPKGGSWTIRARAGQDSGCFRASF